MTTEVSNTNSGLPANISSMATALAAASNAVGGAGGGGELYMQYTKFGEWLYGSEKTEVEAGSKWLLNINDIKIGWLAWDQENTSGGPSGEVLVNYTQGLPSTADLPAVSGDWSECFALTLRCMDGEDAGTQCVYKATSKGARAEFKRLLGAIQVRVAQIQAGEVPAEEIFPIVELGADSYENKSYGKIFTPVVEVVGWATSEGEAPETEEEEPEPEPQPEPAAKPRRRRKKA